MDSPFAITDTVASMPDDELARSPAEIKRRLLDAGESVLVRWIVAHGSEPTEDRFEGFRLLALHRQAARRDPTFNACRESCRELVYQCNVAEAQSDSGARARHFRLAAAVATHLFLFIDGKLENEKLGEFCCSSRPLRSQDAAGASAETQSPASAGR